MEKDIAQLLGKDDDFLIHVMNELEICDDMIYHENLSSANYIYWKARKDTLIEIRDKYCQK